MNLFAHISIFTVGIIAVVESFRNAFEIQTERVLNLLIEKFNTFFTEVTTHQLEIGFQMYGINPWQSTQVMVSFATKVQIQRFPR